MIHDFGLNLHKLIDIKSSKQSNILPEGTFGLFDKQQDEVILVGHDYKQILDKIIYYISHDEDKSLWTGDRNNTQVRKSWEFHTFFKNYDLVFHEFTPVAW